MTAEQRFNIGDTVPDFTIQDSDGRTRQLSELVGTSVRWTADIVGGLFRKKKKR